MGNNCNKGRLCECFHNNCRLSALFDCYQSLFASTSTTITSTPAATESSTESTAFVVSAVNCGAVGHTDPRQFSSISTDTGTINRSTTIIECQEGVAAASGRLGVTGAQQTNSVEHPNNSLAISMTTVPTASTAGRVSTCSNCSGDCCDELKMLRQRSASHCPHQSTNLVDGKRRCCCVNNNDNAHRTGSTRNSTASNGKSCGKNGSTHEMGRTKRASSLRLLNKRFNFPLVNSPKDSERMSTSSCVSAYGKRSENDTNGRQVTSSAVYHHGSSANHQIIYHTGASLQTHGRSSRKQKHLKINQLDDRALMHVFSFLTLRERFYYERVCRRWQSLIRASFAAPASLKIGEHSVKCNCQCDFYPSWDLPPIKKFIRDDAGYIIVPNALLTKLLNHCKALRCINFSHCYLDDHALQIIMANSDTIQCLHLNDIRLEEGSEYGPGSGELNSSGERAPGASDENSAHNSEDVTVTSAMSQFATEQLAVFSGLMRKLSTRNVKKPTNGGKTSGNSSTNETQPLVQNSESDAPCRPNKARSNLSGQSGAQLPPLHSPQNTRKSVAEIGTPIHHKLSANSSYPNIANTTTTTPSSQSVNVNDRRCSCCNRPMPECRSVAGTEPASGGSLNQLNPAMSGKTSNSNIAEAVTESVLYNAIGQRRAAQRRREWSRHRSGNGGASGPVTRQPGEESETDTNMVIASPNASALAGAPQSSQAPLQVHNTNQHKSNSLGENSSSGIRQTRHLISPNMAPNISSLQTDSGNDCAQCASDPNNDDSSDSENEENRNPKRTGKNTKRHAHHHHHHGHHQTNNIDAVLAVSRMSDIQNFVEQEQRRRENRLSHLQHWKNLAKKLGAQIKCLSIGGLTAVDQVVIDLLLKYCVALEELRINNEIDILSYLTIIKHTVKRIFINCEHGIGLECVSLLAFRNYAEKVINLGRVDVPSELIDSVISTIGSNFSNLRSLHLRLHNNDIDLSTPAALLFENLFELNLQFVSGAVDQPFQKLIRLGWNSVQSLTIQYASITEESVRTIGENMPQLRKLILHAVEFRCDHLSRRYGHRICTNCSHAVWKCIASLPHLNHLRLHRVIIDAEICKAISRMSKLCTLELHYCSNVNDNVIGVCGELARRAPRRRFQLSIVSRGFIHYKPLTEVLNLTIDIKVACNN